jgi:hypothetical protein
MGDREVPLYAQARGHRRISEWGGQAQMADLPGETWTRGWRVGGMLFAVGKALEERGAPNARERQKGWR